MHLILLLFYMAAWHNAVGNITLHLPLHVIFPVVARNAELGAPQIPVLCYHQIRTWNKADSRNAKQYIVSPSQFREQIGMLHDAGYHTVLPEQLTDHLLNGTELPPKPVVLTFDDGTITQYTEAIPVLKQYGYKGVFFIMTVTLGRAGYISRQQVREISDMGHVIGCHTWDHHNVTFYTTNDWPLQLIKPTRLLEQITGRQVRYFAYPFGAWNAAAIKALRENAFLAAFQLQGKNDPAFPQFTIRRTIVDGNWTSGQLINIMKR